MQFIRALIRIISSHFIERLQLLTISMSNSGHLNYDERNVELELNFVDFTCLYGVWSTLSDVSNPSLPW